MNDHAFHAFARAVQLLIGCLLANGKCSQNVFSRFYSITPSLKREGVFRIRMFTYEFSGRYFSSSSGGEMQMHKRSVGLLTENPGVSNYRKFD